jgi:nucleotide-binding universal stress UspA family protein
MKKPNIKNILVPVDFSKLSRPAIETAKALARRFDATVHLAHVYEFYYPVGFMGPGTLAPISFPAYEDGAAQRLSHDLVALAKRHDLLPENCHLRKGPPIFNELCQLARDISADLIVTSTHAYAGITRVLEGSTAERLVQHSPCPVLVTRASRRKPSRAPVDGESVGSINSILVPVDFSQCSFQALKYAIDFAERVAARLIVFHVVHFGYAFTADGYAMYDLSALKDTARKNAERQMAKFVRLAKFRGVKFETVVNDGPPISEICDFAEQRDVDLIITATHGRTGFKHLLIGSVAEQMVRYARRPVLVVPSHPEVRAESLARAPKRAQRPTGRRVKSAAVPIARKRLTKKDRKLLTHQIPERRKTNKFRESHSEGRQKTPAF